MILDRAYRASKPLLFSIDPEKAHELSIAALERASGSARVLAELRKRSQAVDLRCQVTAFGATFPHPLGVAAGFDKQAVAYPALEALGFAFIEVGTITPQPQPGNQKPRLFRAPEHEALINRLGFPSAGVDAAVTALTANAAVASPPGINIGPNRESVTKGRAGDDFISAGTALAPFATYLAINISSPNTAQLRDLHGRGALRQMLTEIRAALPAATSPPLLVKISPDLTDAELDDVIGVVAETGCDGIIATNTTTARPDGVSKSMADTRGGLSGRPLASLSSRAVGRIWSQTHGRLPIVAAGGIFSGQDVLAAVMAGATLVQTYTGFVYRGPEMPRRVQNELSEELDRLGIRSLADVRGTAV